MQIKSLHKNIYKLYAWTRTQECLDVYRLKLEYPVKLWQTLKTEKVSDAACSQATGISRATYFRYKKQLKKLDKGMTPPSKKPLRVNKPQWGEAEKQLVIKIRREDETYGKNKIGRILRRDYHLKISDSTVGRILKKLLEKGIVTKSQSAPRDKRKRDFRKGHAKRWTYVKYNNIKPGERIQIDHMTTSKNGVPVKHFQAWERKSKFIEAQIYSHAKSSSAKKFLQQLKKNYPIPIRSIQVDGGSEFMGEFEEACAEMNIPLIVLPPSKPTYNGGVERGNRIFKEEFYDRKNILSDSIGALRFDLKKALHKYNTYRPHQSLKGLTPMEYIQMHNLEDKKSQNT